jgi:hypothetical protein
MGDALKALRTGLKKKVSDQFEVGDVIRWTGGGRYNYAAIKSPVGWFTTANNNAYVPNVVSFDRLLDILNKADSTDIQVAGEWVDVL